jgi:hypothetical protein
VVIGLGSRGPTGRALPLRSARHEILLLAMTRAEKARVLLEARLLALAGMREGVERLLAEAGLAWISA